MKDKSKELYHIIHKAIDKSKNQESTNLIRNDGNEIQSCEDLEDSLFELNEEDFIKYNIIKQDK